MIIHQPRSFDEGEQVTYFSPDLGSRGLFGEEASKRLGITKPMVGAAGFLSGGVNSGGAQPLIQQFPVRPFNTV